MKRQIAKVLAVLVVPGTIANIFKAIERYHRPFPTWFTDTEVWYECAMQAILGAIVFVACVIYIRRRALEDRQEELSGIRASGEPLPYRTFKEFRFALYCWAFMLILALPIGIYKDYAALKDNPPPFENTPWSLLPIEAIIYPPIAAAAILYDRRRMRRESREESGNCLSCGYDLRATPDRCPECGTIPGELRPRQT